MSMPPWGGEDPQEHQPYPPPPPFGDAPAPGSYQPYVSAPHGAPPPPYGGYPAPSNPTNGMAIASMVTSLVGAVGLFCYGIGGVAGLVGAILGHVALGQIKRQGQGGRGLALTGVIVGWVVLAIMVVGWIAIIVFFMNLDPSCQSGDPDYPFC